MSCIIHLQGVFSFHLCPLRYPLWVLLFLAWTWVLSLSVSIFVLPFSFCWVFCLMEFARVSLFSSLLWFQKFGDLFLVFSIFFPIYTRKTQIFLFFPKTLSPQCTNSSPKNKNKKQKIK